MPSSSAGCLRWVEGGSSKPKAETGGRWVILNMVKTLNCLSGRGCFETLLHLKSKIGGSKRSVPWPLKSRVTYVIALIDKVTLVVNRVVGFDC